MKPQPLKGKTFQIPEDNFYTEEDLILAVKWLLYEFDIRYDHGANKEQLKEAIFMAFKDIEAEVKR